MELDRIDCALLEHLQKDARTPYAELGRRVGLSTPSVIERVRKMEDAEVIRGYHAQVAPENVGLPMRAFIKVTIAGDKLEKFATVVRRVPEVREAHRVTGAESYIVQVAVRDIAHLEKVIDALAPYVATQTSLVLASAIEWNPVIPVAPVLR
ncbi:Lrp/AsnC family transcriptional regulator [Terriglobus saanensis]|uniref:Transcriptional regulator, AsnC family n=1 Tax=Terriglobus saanensis (strain ATCC BAA-1853 / DSM 23119 / SP1PR4) TaxID=401053 RepID=E8V7Z9_TERSS|nr:Lrp/AsnC family transcriptional regulator [Terriglobus saanensis]ADV82923.1 transcriptional regulator, AsnC family [Terriglobus saanensis SP1PR4]